VRLERDASHVQVMAAQQDYLAQTHAFSSLSKQLIGLSRALEDRQILLCLQEMDLEVREVMLAEEQACGLHPHNGRDLSVEIEGISARVNGIGGECATEAGQPSQLVMGISMSYPGSKKQNRSLHTCAQDVQITRMATI
jgi:hypothetical protein